METLEEKIQRVSREEIRIHSYDPRWPLLYAAERDHLRSCLPRELILRFEHFGSTAVPGLPAKPIVDMLVEVSSLEGVRRHVAPLLEGQGYEYFWRPGTVGGAPAHYAWFIKRDSGGCRTHHIHMAEGQYDLWEGLHFRDYLRAHPDTAGEYAALKKRLAARHRTDREAYTQAKTVIIRQITDQARRACPGCRLGGAE